MTRQEHWNEIYRIRGAHDVSWHQRRPDLSLELIAESGVSKDAWIIDVGGGASTLVDSLLDAGYQRLAVLDISGEALALSRTRLGPRAAAVEWFEADVTTFQPSHRYGLWHDRAVFHFLTEAKDRATYRAALEKGLASGGTLIVATFAPEGPERCSGLPVQRWSPESLAQELGPNFALLESKREQHRTPGGTVQHFIWCRFKRL